MTKQILVRPVITEKAEKLSSKRNHGKQNNRKKQR